MKACTPNQSNSPHTPVNSGIPKHLSSKPGIDPRDITPDKNEIIMSTYHARNGTTETLEAINLQAPSQGWNWETVVTDPQKRVEICKTRSGRSIKPPVRYEPVEEVEDDYDHEYGDDDESGVYDDDMCSQSDDDDADEDDDGSYEDSFINDEESDYEDDDEIEDETEEEEDGDTDTESEWNNDEDDDDESVGDNSENVMNYYRSRKASQNK